MLKEEYFLQILFIENIIQINSIGVLASMLAYIPLQYNNIHLLYLQCFLVLTVYFHSHTIRAFSTDETNAQKLFPFARLSSVLEFSNFTVFSAKLNPSESGRGARSLEVSVSS